MNHRELKHWLPNYLSAIGVEYRITHNSTRLLCCCPVHQEKTPSFTADSGQAGYYVCHCFGCDFGGTVIDLHAKLNGLSLPADFHAACEGVAAKIGDRYEERDHYGPPRRAKTLPIGEVKLEPKAGPLLPKDATAGTLNDWAELAARRAVSVFAVATAAHKLGTLRFGTVGGHRCWILTDREQLIAEARRMDGKPFEAIGGLNERKAHTLKGSLKSWPVGLTIQGGSIADFRAVLAVEGGPDYLAALHFTLLDKGDCIPVAFLGAGAGGKIHDKALPMFAGKRVRFYQHADEKGQGAAAVTRWANQLAAVGAMVDAFSFAGLRKSDGSRVKDLNDCTDIHADDAAQLAEVLP